jgi:hypothetical protein
VAAYLRRVDPEHGAAVAGLLDRVRRHRFGYPDGPGEPPAGTSAPATSPSAPSSSGGPSWPSTPRGGGRPLPSASWGRRRPATWEPPSPARACPASSSTSAGYRLQSRIRAREPAGVPARGRRRSPPSGCAVAIPCARRARSSPARGP